MRLLGLSPAASRQTGSLQKHDWLQMAPNWAGRAKMTLNLIPSPMPVSGPLPRDGKQRPLLCESQPGAPLSHNVQTASK